MSGGATITDTAIAEDATTESTTGGASRQAIAEMRDGERHIRYHTTLPDASDIPDAQTDDIHVLLDSDENAIALYHFSIVEETEEWLLTVGVGLGIRGYAAGVATGYGHISPNGPSIGFTALNRGTTGRFTLVYDRATTGLVRADSRTLYIRQRGTSGNWHVVQMDEIATPYAYESTTSGHNFTFREGTAYNVIVRRAADTNDGANIAAVLTTERDIAFEDGASLVQLADVQDLLHIGEVVEVVYEQVAGLAAAEVTVDASAFAGNLSATDTDAQTALATIDALTLGGGTASAEPVAYLARAAVDVSSAFAELTLTTALTDGYMLAFDVDSGTGNTVGGRVLVPSTLLRALPAFSAAPTDTNDVEDAYIVPIARVTLTSIITQGLSYVSIWYKDDTHLWIIDSRQEMTAVAISGYPMSGGAALSDSLADAHPHPLGTWYGEGQTTTARRTGCRDVPGREVLPPDLREQRAGSSLGRRGFNGGVSPR